MSVPPVALLFAWALLGDLHEDEAAIPAEVIASDQLRFRGHLEWLNATQATLPRDGSVNPGNRVLAIPLMAVRTELRPDLRFEFGSELAALVRPRFVLDVSRARAGGEWSAERFTTSSEWVELYARWRVDEDMAISFGDQNFQWGPAELVSPSNRIFHESGFLRDPLYVARGRRLVRVNLSAGREWSMVILAEVAPNGEAPFVAEQPFDPKATVKVEYVAPSGDRHVGLVVGGSRYSRGWVGEYGVLPLWEGLSVYADAVHTFGRRGWYPVEEPSGRLSFEQTEMEGRALETMALMGVRYSFESGADVRAEYLYDDAGWDRSDLALAERCAAANPGELGRYLDPGFELLGRRLAYLSVALPDLPPARRTMVQARYLHSITDGSGGAFVTASHAASDSVVLFVSATATHGPSSGAVSRFVKGSGLVGASVSW